MDPATIATLIIAGIATLGFLVGLVGWFYKRGGEERVLSVAVRENTDATRELTKDIRDFRESTIEAIADLRSRVAGLENHL